MKEQKKEQIAILTVLLFILSYLIIWNYDKIIREPREATGVIAYEKPCSEPMARIKSEPVKIIFEDEDDFIEVTDRLSFVELPEAGVLDDSDLETVGVTGVEWASYVPITMFIIENDSGEDIGKLDWSTGKLEFSGKMSCSAKSFFKYFLKPYVDEYIAGELDKKDEISILCYKQALELKQRFPVGGYTYFFKDLQWPITQSIAIEKFIEWLYENDYEIVSKDNESK